MKLKDKAAEIRLLILDVDGVMTDGSIFYTNRGEEIKCFNVKDGHGLRLLMKAGIEVAIITGRESGAVELRAKNLGIKYVLQGIKDKGSSCLKLLDQEGLKKDQVCCIGDDLPDISMFSHVGFPVAVADAAKEVRDAASYVTQKTGGKGAVREVCELILKARGSWPDNKSAPSGK
jgi:3-deoxy-D-manno-octulosonate 8-phosphate phosphatase (KDO 8-P phosphatase)